MLRRIKKISAKASSPAKWVDLYGNQLFRFALARLRNPHLAENAVQETFLAALSAKKRFSGRSSEKTWLIGILKHKIIDHWRNKYREIPETDLLSEEDAVNSFFDNVGYPHSPPTLWLPNPAELVKNKEFWEIFEDCLKKLPPTTAAAFTMREIDQLKGKEICKVLKIRPTNFWIMLYRARLQLRHCLEVNWLEKNPSEKT